MQSHFKWKVSFPFTTEKIFAHLNANAKKGVFVSLLCKQRKPTKWKRWLCVHYYPHTVPFIYPSHTHTHTHPKKRNINFLGTFCKYSVIFFLSLSFTKVLFSFSLDAMRWWQWWCWIEEGESKSAKRKKKYFNDKIHYVVVKLFRDLLFVSCYFSISSLLVDFRLLVQRGGCCCVM